MNPASTTPPATMSATSAPSTIRCCAGARYFVVHLEEDPRGPCRVHDRSRIRVAESRRPLSSTVGLTGRCSGAPGSASNASAEFGRSPFGVTLSVAIPLRSFCPIVISSRFARCALRLQEGGRSAHRSGGCAGRHRRRGLCRWKQILLRRDGSLCHTCSLRQPRLRRGPPLRCAPLRPGLGMKRR